MTVVDEAFAAIPEEFLGIIGWRVENFKLVLVPELGGFHSGDSYLVLHAYKVGRTERVDRDIYYWQGTESTTDERGTVAYKAVELDDFFGGAPKQYREVQDHESGRFVKLFDDFGGLRYLEGGVESGFKKVEINDEVEMYRIKGRKEPVLQQVRAVRGSLNHGDVFIIHKKGLYILWIGESANIKEKNKGSHALDSMKCKDPKAKIIRVEDEPCEELDQAIGTVGEIQPADDKDGAVELAYKKMVFDADFKCIAKDKEATRAALQNDNINYVLCGDKIFCHVGKNAPSDAKRNALVNAQKLAAQEGLPEWIPMEVLMQGQADDDFDIVFP